VTGTKSLRIHVNGEPRDVEKDLSLSQLVATLGLKAEQVAIELNHTVVRRAAWPETQLKADDKIEIVHFVGGGATIIS
jgi:thiamine biosynthesis protein ThiS